MASLSFARRARIAAAGYAVVAVFAAAFAGAGHLPAAWLGSKSPGTADRLMIAAVATAPLALALLWERLKLLKLGEMGVELTEVSPLIDEELAAAVQALESSATPEVVEKVSEAANRTDIRLVELNLRRQPYWWSTRLFLLAALAQEYTAIERLVIVRDYTDRMFVGLATPASVRAAIARRYPGLEEAFSRVLQGVKLGSAIPQEQIRNFGYQWPTQMFMSGHSPVAEEAYRVYVDAELLAEWLAGDLERDSRPWRPWQSNRETYASILASAQAFVPMLRGNRLQCVVDRLALQAHLARDAVS